MSFIESSIRIIENLFNLISNGTYYNDLFEIEIVNKSVLEWIKNDIRYYFKKSCMNDKYDSIFSLSVNSVWIRCNYNVLVTTDPWVRKMKKQNKTSRFHVRIRRFNSERLFEITSKCSKYICEHDLINDDNAIHLYAIMTIIASWMIYDNVCPTNTEHPFTATTIDNKEKPKRLNMFGNVAAKNLFTNTEPVFKSLKNSSCISSLWISENILYDLWQKGKESVLPKPISICESELLLLVENSNNPFAILSINDNEENEKKIENSIISNNNESINQVENDLVKFTTLIKNKSLLELDEYDISTQLMKELKNVSQSDEYNEQRYDKHMNNIVSLYTKRNELKKLLSNNINESNIIMNHYGFGDNNDNRNECLSYLKQRVDKLKQIEELKQERDVLTHELITTDITNELMNDKTLTKLTLINSKIKSINYENEQ